MSRRTDALDLQTVDLTISGLREHYGRGDFSPRELIAALLEKAAADDHGTWIHLMDAAEIEPWLAALPDQPQAELPLYGVPFAIKDNIDLAGVPTTAGCPDFSYTPKGSAFVVQRLLTAGAIPLGKTNMDQFATGLVGVRSPEPWGPAKNALNPKFIAGGSSSGSALAVSLGMVSFALGTDTAGSGRVPASLNNIVGLKPSRGLLSCRGVVPACRSLDCVSIFGLTVDDANTVFNTAAASDSKDAFARENSYGNGSRYFGRADSPLRLGVPTGGQLNLFGNSEAESLFGEALARAKDGGAELVSIDFSPFAEAARLLYEGPWLTERYIAIQEVLSNSPEALLPVIREIIAPGERISAVDTFRAFYRLEELRQRAMAELDKVDAVLTPTAGTIYALDEVLTDPIRLNSNLGFYTNFMNLLDCAAVALPAGFYGNGVGFGVTLFQRAFQDKSLLSIAAVLEDLNDLPLGASAKHRLAKAKSGSPPRNSVDVVVCGAHLDGLALNWQLRERGALLVERTSTAKRYRFYALAGGPPFRPGLVRDEVGAAVEVEVWRLPIENFGSFVAEIPAPLGIGKVELSDGRWLPGFICDHWGLEGATEITQLGGWRRYLQTRQTG